MADPQALINSKAAADNDFIRSPFALEQISADKKLSSNASLAQLYTLVFEGKSPRTDKTASIQDKIDQFFYDQFKQNKLDSFNSKLLRGPGLSTDLMQKHSFVTVNDDLLSVEHLSVMEYHCARFLMYTKDWIVFKMGVESLYNLDKLDKNVMVRKFLTGLTSHKDCPDAKKGVVVQKIVDKLQIFMSNNLLREYKGAGLKKAVTLQSMLLYDVIEFNDEMLMNFRKKFLSEPWSLRMEIDLADTADELPAVLYFLDKVEDSKFVNIIINLSNTPMDQFSQLVEAVMKLTNNMTYMQISNIEFDPSHIELLGQLMGKVNTSMILRYSDAIELPMIELQQAINAYPGLRMFISLTHRGTYGLVRNRAYTSRVTHIMPISHFGGRHLTINFQKYLAKDEEMTKLQIKQELQILFDFVICEPYELKTLTRVLNLFPSIKIHHLSVFLSPENTQMEVHQLCLKIMDLDNKIQVIRFKNIIGPMMNVIEIFNMMLHTGRSLTLFYLEEMEAPDKAALEDSLKDFHDLITRDLFMFVKFNHTSIKVLPTTTKQGKEDQKQAKKVKPKKKKKNRKQAPEDTPLPEDNLVQYDAVNEKALCYPPVVEEEIIPEPTSYAERAFYIYFILIIVIFVIVSLVEM